MTEKKGQEEKRICANCGASVDGSLPVCPYCGAEDPHLARREQAGYLRTVRKQEEALREKGARREQAVKKGKNTMSMVLLLAFVVAVVVAAALIGWHRYRLSRLYTEHQDLAQELDTLLSERSYEALYERMNAEHLMYDRAYLQYARIAKMWHDLTEAGGQLRARIDDMQYYDDAACSDAYGKVFGLLSELRAWEAEGYLFHEEAHAQGFETQLYDLLRQDALLREEEIEDGIARYDGGEEDFKAFAALTRERRSP